MKKYDREKRRWVDEKELTKKQGKRKLCKGGRPHDFQLALPSYVKVVGYPTSEAVLEYYQSEERKEKFLEEENKKLESFGIMLSNHFNFKRHRFFICSVCGKQDYEY